MQSNHMPGVSSSYIRSNNSSANTSNRPSRPKQISPKLRRSPSTPMNSSPSESEKRYQSEAKRSNNGTDHISPKLRRSPSESMHTSASESEKRYQSEAKRSNNGTDHISPKLRRSPSESMHTSPSESGKRYQSEAKRSNNGTDHISPKLRRSPSESMHTSASESEKRYQSEAKRSNNGTDHISPKLRRSPSESMHTSPSESGKRYQSEAKRSNNGTDHISPKLRRSPSESMHTSPSESEKRYQSEAKRSNNGTDHISLKLRRSPSESMHTSPSESEKRYQSETKRSNNGTDHMPPQLRRSNSTAVHQPAPHTSQSNYSAALNLTADVGSIEEGRRLFEFMLRPLTVAAFMDKHWEKKPFRINRKRPKFFEDLLSTEAVDKMLRQNHIQFTKNVNVQFKAGNDAINPVGRATPATIRQYYRDGCGIKILSPQTFLPTIHSMIATLQEYFQCTIDSTVHLGSKNSEGYAPRIEDVETIILQIEGKKHWRIYKYLDRSSMLPSESKNVDLHEMDAFGAPVLDFELSAGDLMYFPRGYVNETTSSADCHSMYLQIGLYRKQTFGDLMGIILPMVLEDAMKESVNLRRGLPLDIWQNMGVVNCDNDDRERESVLEQIKECFETVRRHVQVDTNLDNAVDQMALRYQRGALPPKLTPEEHARSAYGTKITAAEDGSPKRNYLGLDTRIRLIRANVVRMVLHGNGVRVYYSSEDSKNRQGPQANFLEMESTEAPAVEVLIKAYPLYITPRDLQLEGNDKNLFVAQKLWERGVLMSHDPLV